jgi:hypothetical protein
LNDSFAGQSTLELKLFSFSDWNNSFHALLAFKLSVERSAVILMGYLYRFFFPLTAFSILSLFSVLVVLMIVCSREVLFWSSLFGVLETSCTECAKLSQDLGNFLLSFY